MVIGRPMAGERKSKWSICIVTMQQVAIEIHSLLLVSTMSDPGRAAEN